MERAFVDLKEIYHNTVLDSENYQVYYSRMTQLEIDNFRLRFPEKPEWYFDGLSPNTDYVTLFKKGEKVMMSDVPMEKLTNQEFLNKASGDVLIAGLGIGMIIFPLLKDPSITSITIIELDHGLIDIIKPIIDFYDYDKKVKIVNENIFEFSKSIMSGSKWNTIYFDIWISILGSNFPEMEKLHQEYNEFLSEDGYMSSWCYDYCKEEYNRVP